MLSKMSIVEGGSGQTKNTRNRKSELKMKQENKLSVCRENRSTERKGQWRK